MSQEDGRSPEEARRQIEEDRKHSLRVARVSIYPAIITALATILAAFIGVLWKADTVGAKVNAETGQAAGVISNLRSGWQTLASITDPSKSLSAAIPHRTPDPKATAVAPALTPNQVATAPAAPQAPPAPDISTDPAVLASCYGLGSLKPRSVRVLSSTSGYSISMRMHNDGATEVLYVEQPQLTDSNKAVPGNSNIPYGPFYIGKTTDPKQLLDIYSSGTTIAGNDDGSVNFNFPPTSPQSGNQTVTFGATFLHFNKATDGEVTRLSTGMTCQAIPVVKSP